MHCLWFHWSKINKVNIGTESVSKCSKELKWSSCIPFFFAFPSTLSIGNGSNSALYSKASFSLFSPGKEPVDTRYRAFKMLQDSLFLCFQRIQIIEAKWKRFNRSILPIECLLSQILPVGYFCYRKGIQNLSQSLLFCFRCEHLNKMFNMHIHSWKLFCDLIYLESKWISH